jgi:hypothetical protein
MTNVECRRHCRRQAGDQIRRTSNRGAAEIGGPKKAPRLCRDDLAGTAVACSLATSASTGEIGRDASVLDRTIPLRAMV